MRKIVDAGAFISIRADLTFGFPVSKISERISEVMQRLAREVNGFDISVIRIQVRIQEL